MKVKVITKVVVDGQEVAKEKLAATVSTVADAIRMRADAHKQVEGLANRLIAEAGFNA